MDCFALFGYIYKYIYKKIIKTFWTVQKGDTEQGGSVKTGGPQRDAAEDLRGQTYHAETFWALTVFPWVLFFKVTNHFIIKNKQNKKRLFLSKYIDNSHADCCQLYDIQFSSFSSACPPVRPTSLPTRVELQLNVVGWKHAEANFGWNIYVFLKE